MSCRKCWKSDARPVELARDGEVFAIVDICDACFERAHENYKVLRMQFEELLAAGVPRDKANEIMCARIAEAATS